MKLRDKNTGEILNITIKCENGGELKTFDLKTNTDKPISLAELNENWEDVEEPKEHWCVTMYGGITRIKDNEALIDDLIEIGNWFETKEDAYDALDKLKAWKRLKDKGLKICGWCNSDNVDLNGCGFNDDNFIVGLGINIEYWSMQDLQDFKLLFGGE